MPLSLALSLSFSLPFFIAYAISGTDASLSVFLRIEILEEYAEFPLEELKIIIQQAQRICTTDEIMYISYIYIFSVSMCVWGLHNSCLGRAIMFLAFVCVPKTKDLSAQLALNGKQSTRLPLRPIALSVA